MPFLFVTKGPSVLIQRPCGCHLALLQRAQAFNPTAAVGLVNLPQCASAGHNIVMFLAGTLVSPVPSVLQKLRTWALGSDLGWSLGVSYWLWGLMPSSSWLTEAPNSLLIWLGEQRSPIWVFWKVQWRWHTDVRIETPLTVTSVIFNILCYHLGLECHLDIHEIKVSPQSGATSRWHNF